MSTLDQARPHGYSKAGKHARRHARSMEQKQDHTAVKFSDPRNNLNTYEGAQTVPGYYAPPNEKYYRYHPRERDNIPTTIVTGVGQSVDPADDVAREQYAGFQRDLEQQDISRWEMRREMKLQQEYDKWLTRRFDISNPHVARWLRKVEPEFWDRRWAFLQDKMELETFLTRMRLYGPHTREDFEGIFALHNDQGLAHARRPMVAGAQSPRVRYTEGRLARGSSMFNTAPITRGFKAGAYGF